jgi:hypothetical protein
MTPKEKAIELVDTYKFVLWSEDTQCGDEILCTGIAKRCALIAVDEIINQCWDYREIDLQASYDYWEQVKKEIQLL